MITDYELQILAEYDDAVIQLRKILTKFLTEHAQELEAQGGGSLDGKYTPCSASSGLTFVAFAWGIAAEGAAQHFARVPKRKTV